MSNIQVTVTGDKEFVRKLRSFTSGPMDLKRSLGASGLYLTNFFSGEVFASRGRVIGQPWSRLNESYATWKARMFPGRPPLIRSGEMQRSFFSKASAQRLELGNRADHFQFHNEGTGNVPQRVMMRIDEQRAARVAKYIIGDLGEQMTKAGLV